MDNLKLDSEITAIAEGRSATNEQTSEPVVSSTPIDDMEVWDYENMRDDCGW